MMIDSGHTEPREPFVIQGPLFTLLNDNSVNTYDYFDSGSMVVGDQGRILYVGPSVPADYSHYRIKKTQHLIFPGFIDAHVHYPQLPVIASYGVSLLEWLDKYTFPEEAKYSQRLYAERRARQFLELILQRGVTSAAVFSTIHQEAFDALLGAASYSGFNLVSGVTGMNRGAPDDVLVDVGLFKEISSKAMESGLGVERFRYAITPRFALSCDEEMLDYCGQLLEINPHLLMQTHINETEDEVLATSNLFPRSTDYLDVYDAFGLLGDRSLFAHGIYTTESEYKRWAASGASVIHCPTSNTFLGSGLFNASEYVSRNINIGMGSDVGGGFSLNPFVTMSEAYKVARLGGKVLDPLQLVYWHTLGSAKAINQADVIGSLESGKWADFCLIDITSDDIGFEVWERSRSVQEKLFGLMFLLPDSSSRVVETYAGGISRWRDTSCLGSK
ncbi:MAG: guanine deaminase [Gammaproteobacteria bacterium]|nr:guanine deaminase [Gammaproteobacteria bacterium]